MAQKLKVLVGGHDLKFWQSLQDSLEETGEFEFRQDVWTGHNSHDPAKSDILLDWADVIVAEWTLGNAVYYSKHKRPHQRLLTRFHLQERDTPYPAELQIEAVEKILFVGQHILEEAAQKFSLPAETVDVIGNFVDMAAYKRNKFGDSQFYVGMIGTAPRRKRLDLAVDVLDELLNIDPRYRLHIKGNSPQSISWLWARTAERNYYTDVYNRINSSDRLRHKVIFDPQGHDVASWLTKIGYLISPSDFESFHMAVAEGIASGAVPVIWPWEGADTLYPFALKISDPATVAKQIDMLRRSRSRATLMIQAQSYVAEHYDRNRIRDRWRDILLKPASDAGRHGTLPCEQVTIVWGIDSWDMFHRREMLEALAENLGEQANLLYIEPHSHASTLLKAHPDQAGRLRQDAMLRPRNPRPNVYAMRLLTGGFPNDMPHDPLLTGKNSRGEKAEAIARQLWGENVRIVHWIYKPDQMQFLPENADFIYEVYDDYTLDFSSGEILKDMAEQEPRTLAKARHVFFTSDVLSNRKSVHARSSTMVPNGVDFEAFRKHAVEKDAFANGRPTVGYLGNLSDFFDWETMGDVCQLLPEVDFIFHGQVEMHRLKSRQEAVQKLMDLPNTLFTGRVSRPVGAAAVARYDVLTIPFVVNDAMHAVNPLKLWEYFAVGLPVVSSPMHTIQLPDPVLRVAHNTEEWVAALRAAIAERDPKLTEERLALARSTDWKTLTAIHAGIIRNA